MKRGSYLVNTARGKICDAAAVAEACESGQLAGYAGDVWFPQPPPADHPWRSMPRNAMTPHVSGTSLSAQARYAAGVREILECLDPHVKDHEKMQSLFGFDFPEPEIFKHLQFSKHPILKQPRSQSPL